MNSMDFAGRVAVITGSGRGIGRAHATLLASRGAAVVVNDIGGNMGGGGGDDSLAQLAANEIISLGGRAVADTSDISTKAGATSLIRHAIESFGRVDIVVNNAGIFTMDTFPDLEFEELEKQFLVHIGGSFNVTRAAWPYMQAAGYGRVVLTTSASALGAPDTVAYTTAKAAVIGLARSFAMVGRDQDILVNMIAPSAFTRMMSAGMGLGEVPIETVDRGPELVSPMIAVLTHESCPTTGEIYASGMRRFSRFFLSESPGMTFAGTEITPELVRKNWAKIHDPEDSTIVADVFSWSDINERHLAKSAS